MGNRVSKSKYDDRQLRPSMSDSERQKMAIEGAILERGERLHAKVLNGEVKEARRLPPAVCKWPEVGYVFPLPENKPIELIKAMKVHGPVADYESLRNTSFYINNRVQEVIANQKDHTGYLLLVSEDDHVARADFEIYLRHFDFRGLPRTIMGYSFVVSTVSFDSLRSRTFTETIPHIMPTLRAEEFRYVSNLVDDTFQAWRRDLRREIAPSPSVPSEEEGTEEADEDSIDLAMAYGELPEETKRERDRREKEDEDYDPNMAYGNSYSLDKKSKRNRR